MNINLKWYLAVLVGVAFLTSICTIPLWFQTNGLSALSPSDVTDITKTKLTVDATLFGLSTLSGAIFLSVSINGEKARRHLTYTIVFLMAISFASFILTLILDFMSLGNPSKFTLVFSMGLTISGALSGSFYLVWSFADYLHSLTEETEKTPAPT